jgi:hypothetical protein
MGAAPLNRSVTPAEMFTLPPDFEWIPPWEPIKDESAVLGDRQLMSALEAKLLGKPSPGTVANSLAAELRREMPAGHRLARCNLRAVGRCIEDADDILFTTDDDSAPLAVVHLTWHIETDPVWPYTVIYHSLEDWIAQMKHENRGVRWANLRDDEE